MELLAGCDSSSSFIVCSHDDSQSIRTSLSHSKPFDASYGSALASLRWRTCAKLRAQCSVDGNRWRRPAFKPVANHRPSSFLARSPSTLEPPQRERRSENCPCGLPFERWRYSRDAKHKQRRKKQRECGGMPELHFTLSLRSLVSTHIAYVTGSRPYLYCSSSSLCQW